MLFFSLGSKYCPWEGTAVLRKFDSLSKAQEYIKYFYLYQFGYSSIGYEYQLFKANVSKSATDDIKNSRRKENLKATKSKERANFCTKKKVAELSNNRKRLADIRMHASTEKRAVERVNVEKYKLIDKISLKTNRIV